MKSLQNVLLHDAHGQEFILDIYSDGTAACWSLDRSRMYELPLMILRTEKGYCVRKCSYSRYCVDLGDTLFECKKKHEADDFVISYALECMSRY